MALRGPCTPSLSRSMLVVLAVAILVAVPAQAVPPNARAAALATPGPILDLAVSDAGLVVAATEDPGSTPIVPGTADAAASTWHVWNALGTGLQSGSSDMAECAERIGDMCTTDAVAAAVASDGSRFVIGSNPARSVVDDAQGLLLIGKPSEGIKVRYTVLNPIQFVGVDKTGTNIAVVESVRGVDGSTTSVVEAFKYDGATVTELFDEPYEIPAAATSLAVAGDGLRFVVGADKHYRFIFSSSAVVPAPGIQGTVGSVAIGDVAPTISMAGYSTGQVAFFSDLLPGAPMFSQKPASAAITATAIQPRSSAPLAVAGDSAGNLHIFQLDPTKDPTGRFVRTQPLGGGTPLQMQFSADGTTLLAITATDVLLLQAGGDSLTALWKDPVVATAGDLSANGDLVAVATEAGVRIYDAVHKLSGTPAPTTGIPGQTATVQVTLRNQGTRAEDASFTVVQPANWAATVSPATLRLDPDASGTVTVTVPIPANTPPGTAPVSLQHKLASGSTGQTPLGLTVAPQVQVTLKAEGAASQAINPGATIQFKAKVENRGNQLLETAVRANVDLPGWSTAVTPPSVRIEPGGDQTVSVTLTAAGSAKEGDRGHVQLAAAAKPDEVLHLYGTVGARFAVAVVAPGGASVQPGNTTTVDVTVQNRGNTVDSFDVGLLDVPVGWTGILDAGGSTAQLLDTEPGSSTTVRLTLRAPADAVAGQQFRIQVQATSLGKAEVHAERAILLTVGEPAQPPEEGTPGPGALLLLAVLVAGALAHRSSRRRI